MATRRGSRAFLWIVMALVAVGLVGWGSGGLGGRVTTVGTVAGRPIEAQAYANALRDTLAAASERAGQTLTLAQARALGFDPAQVMAQVVRDEALDAEAARLGLSVADSRVADAVLASPAFQGLDGAFDRELYAEQLSRNGLDEARFEASLRDGAARSMLQAAVLGGVPEPAAYADAWTAFAGERRTITWAPLTTANIADPPEPAEADLRAYHEANPTLFTAPEVRAIAYAWLTPEMIQDEVEVDDEAVRALYDERIDEFVQEERRLVERLAMPSEDTAEAARARIDAGEATFEAVVEERGVVLSDIDLGDVTRGELGEAADAVFAAAAGDVLGPLPSSLGPALYRVNAVLAADEVTFEEAAPDLRSELANQRARRVIGEAVAGIEDLIAGGATVEDLAERTDLEAGSIEWSDGVTDGISAYETFRVAAAAAEEGAPPGIVELTDGGVFALRLDGVTPPRLRPFEEVAAEVEAGWRADALGRAVAARAEEAAAAIADGASFESQDLVATTEPPLTRRDVVDGTPPETMGRAFALAEGEAAALASGDGAVVIRLDAVTDADPEDPAVLAERAAVAADVSAALAGDLLQAYAVALQAATEVRVDDAAVTAVNAQFE